jgi:hypothetical protein
VSSSGNVHYSHTISHHMITFSSSKPMNCYEPFCWGGVYPHQDRGHRRCSPISGFCDSWTDVIDWFWPYIQVLRIDATVRCPPEYRVFSSALSNHSVRPKDVLFRYHAAQTGALQDSSVLVDAQGKRSY